jgi:hypothetical protein
MAYKIIAAWDFRGSDSAAVKRASRSGTHSLTLLEGGTPTYNSTGVTLATAGAYLGVDVPTDLRHDTRPTWIMWRGTRLGVSERYASIAGLNVGPDPYQVLAVVSQEAAGDFALATNSPAYGYANSTIPTNGVANTFVLRRTRLGSGLYNGSTLVTSRSETQYPVWGTSPSFGLGGLNPNWEYEWLIWGSGTISTTEMATLQADINTYINNGGKAGVVLDHYATLTPTATFNVSVWESTSSVVLKTDPNLLTVRINTGATTPTSVTWGGVALTLRSSVLDGAGRGVYLYDLLNHTVGTANLVVTSSVSDACRLTVSPLSNVDPSTPRRTVGTLNSSGSNSSIVVTTVAGDLTLDVLTAPAALTIGGGQNTQFNGADLVAGFNGTSSEEATTTATTMSWTHGTGARAMLAMPYTAAAPGTIVTLTGVAVTVPLGTASVQSPTLGGGSVLRPARPLGL